MIRFLNKLSQKSLIIIASAIGVAFLSLTILLVALLSGGSNSIYVASDKDEILANVQEYFENEGEEFKTVNAYLRAYGLPIYDSTKFAYMEACFNAYYNYADGLGETEEHAKNTAELFLEKYYDDLDKRQVKEITDSLLYCYVEALDDPYSVYRPPVEADEYTEHMSGSFGGIGVVVKYDYEKETIQVDTVYIDSPAEKAGIQVGDLIDAVDGTPITEIGIDEAVYHIRGEIGTKVELTLIRGDKPVTVVCTREKVDEISVDYEFDEDNENIGYIRIVSFKDNTLEQFTKAVDEMEKQGAEGIIFDLRGNPGGYLHSVVDVISYMIPTDNLVVSYEYKGHMKTELHSEDDGEDEGGKPIDHTVTLPIVVICDEYTASAGEIFTAAVRDYRDMGLLDATIVGTRTYAKGIMQNTYSYTDGSSVTFTVAYYDPPSGVNYHEIGVEPDIKVELPEPVEDPETGKLYIEVNTQYDAAVFELKKLINVK